MIEVAEYIKKIQDKKQHCLIKDNIRQLTERDYQQMLQQLQITSLQPGANGSIRV